MDYYNGYRNLTKTMKTSYRTNIQLNKISSWLVGSYLILKQKKTTYWTDDIYMCIFSSYNLYIYELKIVVASTMNSVG